MLDYTIDNTNSQKKPWARTPDKKKKVLVINGSPKKVGGATLRVTNAFLRGLCEDGGFEVETVNLFEMNIKPCMGCLSCWGHTAGECVIKNDDIPALRDKVMEADVIIESFPLYVFSMPGTVKVMTDRLLSLLSTYHGQHAVEGESFHGFRYPMGEKRFLIVSTCGYISTDMIYDPLLMQYDCICGRGNYQAILCPQGKVMLVPELYEKIELFLEKYVDAGREFAKYGELSAETVELLKKPPFSDRRFRLLLDRFWTEEMAEAEHKEDFRHV